ncbi:hypothetical protein [Mesorhizobium sp. M0013]|uniref:hypothetical protein n=1 Tax=Mesorhizobium sp. M0013 TaxID=2956841 RepID=UPI00333A8059
MIEEYSGVGRERRRNEGYVPHRTVSQTAKEHAPIVAAIRAAIPDGSLALAACAKAKADDEATEALARAAYVSRIRHAIEHDADRMQLEGKGQAPTTFASLHFSTPTCLSASPASCRPPATNKIMTISFAYCKQTIRYV